MSPLRRIKVARVIARLSVGGPARQACFLHENLKNRFDTVLITGAVDRGETEMTYLLASEEGVYRLNTMSRPIRFWADTVSFFRLLSILRREKPDILHTHAAKAGALARMAGFLLRIPVIVHTYHGNVFSGYFSPSKSFLISLIEKCLNRITTRVIAISDSQARDLSELYGVVGKKKISVILTGHDLSKYTDYDVTRKLRERLRLVEYDKKIVVWAGRLVPVKNVPLLAEIVRAASYTAPHLHFVIVGDGTERRLLEHLVAGCQNCSLLGWHSDMKGIWSAADIALGTSLNEGTPAAFIEAMAAGKPFVSTAVGGVLDLAVNPRTQGDLIVADNCLLSSPSSSKLLKCLVDLADNPTLASSMGRCGRKFVEENYQAEQMLEELTSLYEDLTATRV